ncbi:hypothetical protein M427DRAFT_302389 [Gonapodya prolifera JEL478]|uniref:Amidohydrolase-related domain-containing protein n=1 Tax=Gonapodya prolifera (strain JEL478) TaxID=1344416 RepID=A0A139AHA5_GONPJ|nr:hypothetical protein M427DRAFT_302389 [Gonapodya prolifera JEL478]|eukprot:KXS16186.1 hypothetical protein M427DRAFT_302389 [Gonapodya prolifera JEL478]
MRSSDGSSMDESAWAQSIANESKNQVCTGIQSAIDMVQSPQNFESALLSALKHPNFRGLRRIATKRDPVTGGYSGIEENPTVLELPNVRQNFATLNKHKMSYEVWYRLKPESSRATTAGFLSVVKNNPDVTFIVDHFLEPQGAYRDDAGMWNDCKHVMAEYSKFPNVYAKLSGLMPGLGGGFHLRQDHQKPSAVELAEGRFGEMVGYALDVFGPNKCMFGSNFPVDRISASLGDLVACYWLVGKSKGLSESGLREVFSGSCRRAYKLDGK